MSAWLTVLGISEDGAAGLSPSARALLDTAALPRGDKEETLQLSARSFGWSRAGEPSHWLAGSARSW